ncbi:FtsW/RodA/SpoVE family cell cycle protein [Paenibacillus filicis]|uniref:FtsW/RodA/SpoVE family cell cycle protein n=1 Tax=Paenibacillus gyeongsangnamensis TaxID=3388067 RepID=A0ABT4Q427_9BACL|nr:FtsW/RodA/SpoVE family cell cycle protein [Paenibacillus filicis]MCZ8511566.1 FtsW/RodA/SpoVE family cell cycle protein [Paenibacillus filicis]
MWVFLQNKLKKLDPLILIILVFFLIISTMVIYSATWHTKYAGIHKNNLIMFGVLFIPVIGLSVTDYRIFVRHLSIILYVVGIILLGFVMFKGMDINGAKRWIDLHFMQFQPSELVKVFVILLLAKLLEHREGRTLRFFRDIIPMALVTAIPFMMVLEQPDLGTSFVFVCIFIGMLWMGNVRILHAIGGLVGFTSVVGGLTWLYFRDFNLLSKILKPYQLHRIQTFLDPNSNPDQSYQVVNSIQSVGSGQLLGEGYLHGTMVQGGFIPYDYADSIFVVVGEEFGFIGSAVLILLYFFLIYRMILIAIKCNDLAGRYLVIGVISMLAFQIFENIAMHTGLMPLTGIALPFISYGGTSLLTNMISMGLVLSVKVHQLETRS